MHDTGKGITTETLLKLGTAPVSFSGDKGHGLGVFHAFKTIESYGGKVEIESTIHVGTCVRFMLPVIAVAAEPTPQVKKYILIDDDQMVRETWEIAAMNYKVTLLSFPSYESFLKSTPLDHVAEYAVYVDENLGGGASGKTLIPQIRELGFTKVILATGGYRPPGAIDTHDKIPPWLSSRTRNTASKVLDEDARQRVVS